MKKVFLLPFLFGGFFVTAQQITVEKIYANYIEAIGGKEKIDNIVNQMKVSMINTLNTTFSSIRATTKTTENQVMTIDFIDIQNQQTADITKNYSNLSENQNTYSQKIMIDGKMITILPDGQKYETPYLEKLNSDFLGTTIPVGSKVLINETFNGKEVYVVNYEQKIAGGKQTVYEYFDIVSSLKLGYKKHSESVKEETNSYNTTTTIYIDSMSATLEYKKMNNILYPYKEKGSFNMENTTVTTTESLITLINNDSSLGVKIDENKADEKLKQKEGKTIITKLHSEWETEILAVEFNI
ncbi:MAG: hypothetical protein WCY89_07965, partial [Flavobacteriaceae bacterium]